MLLIFDRPLSPAHGASLMEIYRESNTENIDYFFPNCTDRAEGLRQVEAQFLAFVDEFLAQEENTYYVWEEGGVWLAALRLTRMEGFHYLEALETRPDARRRGCGEALLRAVLAHLGRSGPVCVRDCVGKKNAPSLAIHKKVGFTIDQENGIYYLDGSVDEHSYGLAYRG